VSLTDEDDDCFSRRVGLSLCARWEITGSEGAASKPTYIFSPTKQNKHPPPKNQTTQFTAELFRPPYASSPDRPTITLGPVLPEKMGGEVLLEYEGDADGAVLMAPAAVTHQVCYFAFGEGGAVVLLFCLSARGTRAMLVTTTRFK
jgi:hypothetical protein